jgi:hypothetical protein
MSHEEIALGLGISRNTLEKHFERELSIGAYEKRLDVLDAMQRTAKRGNVAAQKAYLQLTRASRRRRSPARTGRRCEAFEARQKGAGAADARGAQIGTEWDDLLRRADTPLQ